MSIIQAETQAWLNIFFTSLQFFLSFATIFLLLRFLKSLPALNVKKTHNYEVWYCTLFERFSSELSVIIACVRSKWGQVIHQGQMKRFFMSPMMSVCPKSGSGANSVTWIDFYVTLDFSSFYRLWWTIREWFSFFPGGRKEYHPG